MMRMQEQRQHAAAKEDATEDADLAKAQIVQIQQKMQRPQQQQRMQQRMQA